MKKNQSAVPAILAAMRAKRMRNRLLLKESAGRDPCPGLYFGFSSRRYISFIAIGERAVRLASDEMECMARSGFGVRRMRAMRESVRGAILQAVSTKLEDKIRWV